MRILKLLLMVLACLGGGQVMAESPWPTNDTSGAMTLAGGGHFKGGHHSKGFGHRHFHGPIRHHHGFNGHPHRFHHGFMGHSHRFGMFHKRHNMFFVDDPRFSRHHHIHRFHDRPSGFVIRFHDSRSGMFTDSDFHR
ncbi:hypothetical protein E8F11_04745 [Pseudomonas sp. BN417]|uniref:hypothetical protein n=1 Tax=Pseudomonas sp. BN417 TaxID=2567890 RepID=UPI0024551557|nr:hypothetical protein [Pseudomonas sp. BN417]MDH4554494.1 hypothetical protein [Pseudomonas sp. BN417]